MLGNVDDRGGGFAIEGDQTEDFVVDHQRANALRHPCNGLHLLYLQGCTCGIMGMHEVKQACFLVDEVGQLFQVGSPAIFDVQGESTYLEAEGTGDAWEVL